MSSGRESQRPGGGAGTERGRKKLDAGSFDKRFTNPCMVESPQYSLGSIRQTTVYKPDPMRGFPILLTCKLCESDTSVILSACSTSLRFFSTSGCPPTMANAVRPLAVRTSQRSAAQPCARLTGTLAQSQVLTSCNVERVGQHRQYTTPTVQSSPWLIGLGP